MELYFLGLNDLDRPVHKVDNFTLFNCQPFYDDYYVVLYLKKVHIPTSNYKAIIINDRDLVINYGANDLPLLISKIIAAGEQVRFHTFKVIYRIMVLKNGWWCVYIEKRYIWNCFESKGVVTIISPSKTAVLDFFQKYFVPKLEKRKPKLNRDKLITLNLQKQHDNDISSKSGNGNNTTNITELVDLLPLSTSSPSPSGVVGTCIT